MSENQELERAIREWLNCNKITLYYLVSFAIYNHQTSINIKIFRLKLSKALEIK